MLKSDHRDNYTPIMMGLVHSGSKATIKDITYTNINTNYEFLYQIMYKLNNYL